MGTPQKLIPKIDLNKLTMTEVQTYLKNLHTEKALVLAQVREYDNAIKRVNLHVRDLQNPGNPQKILQLLALGYQTNKELAQKLGISQLSVRRRMSGLLKEGKVLTYWDNGHVKYELRK